jgi:hypothetical protein
MNLENEYISASDAMMMPKQIRFNYHLIADTHRSLNNSVAAIAIVVSCVGEKNHSHNFNFNCFNKNGGTNKIEDRSR